MSFGARRLMLIKAILIVFRTAPPPQKVSSNGLGVKLKILDFRDAAQ